MNPSELQYQLTQFHGTDKWRRHPLNPRLLHTDGVEFFAEKAGAYWFIDAIALGVYGRKGVVPDVIPGKSTFGIVLLHSKDGAGAIEVYTDSQEDGTYSLNDRIFHQFIEFTDLPHGTWRFYLIDDGDHAVLLCPSEY
jgi:hypothetical protein